MSRISSLIAISFLAWGLNGCGGGRPIKYYTAQLPAAPNPSTHANAVPLLVGRISAPAILKDGPIAYRVGANEIGTYTYHRWEEPPTEMLKQNLMHVLRASGDFQSVTALQSGSEGEYVVRGRLDNFEEVDGASISALVSMELELYNRKTGQVVWSHFYSQSEPVDEHKVSAVVSALDRNLDRGVKQAASGLGQYFSKSMAKNP
ncbi:MAG: membrane integrity-associated transporter subunit PqiC [Acidobacteriaceae bacterium]|nr:membrane integrity-associated transporter subunit PqiC [Acidobacteriaceae bacterium]